MVCQGVSSPTQRAIDREPAKPPLDPDERIRAEIDRLIEQQKSIKKRLKELDEELAEWIPTRYRPDPNRKGGK